MASPYQRLLKMAKDMAASGCEQVDPDMFHDPLAYEVDWTPLVKGGNGMHTHQLVEPEPDRIEFHATGSAKALCAAWVSMGTIAFGLGVYDIIRQEGSGPGTLTCCMGLVFAGGGIWQYYRSARPVIFDLRRGFSYRGTKSPEQVVSLEELPGFVSLERVRAIQLISETCQGRKRRTYRSYELNLVLDTAERVNVTDHCQKTEIRNDAERLGKKLGVPVWDAI